MLYFRITGKEGRSADQIALLKAKSKRRALRHFQGKEVRHRVVHKEANLIEFAWFRRTANKVSIRWRRVEPAPAPTKPARSRAKSRTPKKGK